VRQPKTAPAATSAERAPSEAPAGGQRPAATAEARPPAGGRGGREWWRSARRRRWVLLGVLAAAVAALVVLLTAGSELFDEPLRRELEARMNQRLRGYSLQLGHAHARLLGLDLTLRGLVLRQQDHPEPPIATIPLLHLSLEWRELLGRHLVGDAYFDHPHLHLDEAQLHVEYLRRIHLGQRGWQAALESIYPFKFNTFRVNEGSMVYIDEDPARPLEITHWMLTATNVRNLHYADRVYPSPVHTEGTILGTGRGTIDGHANFLSDPYPGYHALYRVEKVPLARLQQLGSHSSFKFYGGRLSSDGEVEYSPRFKLIDVANLQLEGVRLDYVHTAAAEERRRLESYLAFLREVGQEPAVVRIDRLRLLGGSVGYVNQATEPHYRIYVDHADLEMLHVSNRAAQLRREPATARLRGRFMGGGSATAAATFRPGSPHAEFGGELAIENAQLPAFNDFLRAHGRMELAGGTGSVYSQFKIENGQLHGYVKTLFDDVKLYDPHKDRNQPLGVKLKEKVLGGLAELLENRRSDRLATRTELSGTVEAPRTNTTEILGGLLRNAFVKGIVPGFDQATAQGHHPRTKKPG
jgi:Domain of Unknown Function (DUF748)